MSDSLQSHGLQLTRVLCPWNSPGKNTEVGCHSILQGLFPSQGSNLDLLHCRKILYHLSQQVVCYCFLKNQLSFSPESHWRGVHWTSSSISSSWILVLQSYSRSRNWEPQSLAPNLPPGSSHKSCSLELQSSVKRRISFCIFVKIHHILKTSNARQFLQGCYTAYFCILYHLKIKTDTCLMAAWSCYFESGEAVSKIVSEVVRK